VIVAVAAERYRRAKGHGRRPPGDLVTAGFLKAVPTDPYVAGQPIKFARPADGLIVFATGPDGKDDGGKLDRSTGGAEARFRSRLSVWTSPHAGNRHCAETGGDAAVNDPALAALLRHSSWVRHTSWHDESEAAASAG